MSTETSANIPCIRVSIVSIKLVGFHTLYGCSRRRIGFSRGRIVVLIYKGTPSKPNCRTVQPHYAHCLPVVMPRVSPHTSPPSFPTPFDELITQQRPLPRSRSSVCRRRLPVLDSVSAPGRVRPPWEGVCIPPGPHLPTIGRRRRSTGW